MMASDVRVSCGLVDCRLPIRSERRRVIVRFADTGLACRAVGSAFDCTRCSALGVVRLNSEAGRAAWRHYELAGTVNSFVGGSSPERSGLEDAV